MPEDDEEEAESENAVRRKSGPSRKRPRAETSDQSRHHKRDTHHSGGGEYGGGSYGSGDDHGDRDEMDFPWSNSANSSQWSPRRPESKMLAFDVSRSLGFKINRQGIVTRVDEGSQAEDLGVTKGSRVFFAHGSIVTHRDAIQDALRAFKAERKAALKGRGTSAMGHTMRCHIGFKSFECSGPSKNYSAARHSSGLGARQVYRSPEHIAEGMGEGLPANNSNGTIATDSHYRKQNAIVEPVDVTAFDDGKEENLRGSEVIGETSEDTDVYGNKGSNVYIPGEPSEATCNVVGRKDSKLGHWTALDSGNRSPTVTNEPLQDARLDTNELEEEVAHVLYVRDDGVDND